jgi:hypothetical protein
MKTLSMMIWVLIIPFLSFSQQMTEILGRPTNTSITMNILFDSQVEVYFEYGTVKGTYPKATTVIKSVLNEPVETSITGLLAGTRYYYRTRYRKIGETTYLASAEHTFITQRKAGSSFRFTMEADIHIYDKKGNGPVWTTTLQNQLKDTADFMIDLGDTFGDDHNATTITSKEVQQLQLNCRAYFGKVCHSLPLYFCIGNHEGEFGYYLLQTPPNNLATYETLWRKKYYPNPYPDGFYTGNTTEEGNGIGKPENYYAWEWGDALFIVLDAYRYPTANEKPEQWDWTLGKQQYDWFKQTLENNKSKFKFVFAHHLLGQGRGGVNLAKNFEWGGYNTKGTWEFDKYRPGWALPIHQLMKANKVDVFFQGHDHLYAREELDGIVYQEVPMPSDSSYEIGMLANADAYTGKIINGSGHLRVTVTPDMATVDYVSSKLPKDETATLKNGAVVYSYSIKKSTVTSISNENQLSTSLNTQNWSVFPNPAGDEINISFNQEVDKELLIQIINIEGKVVKQIERIGISNAGNIINTKLYDNSGNKLNSGIYLVRVIADGKNISSKKIAVKCSTK